MHQTYATFRKQQNDGSLQVGLNAPSKERMISALRNLPGPIKKKLKNIAKSLGILGVLRLINRRSFAMSYYSQQIAMIKEWTWKDTEDSNFYYKLNSLNNDQLAQTVSTITGISYSVILQYFNELESDYELRKHIKVGITTAKYGKDIKVDFGRRLGWYAFIRSMKPKVVIETGVDHGVGACVITSALIRNASEGLPGYYYGTEINPEAGKLLSGKYQAFGEILYGDSITSLRKFDKEIDIFINDSDHSADYEYLEYQEVSNKLSENAVVLGDNSHVTDKLSQFSREANRKFLFFSEKPANHWYPGAGIGISFKEFISNK